jgi:hypothetical protein
VRRRPRKEAAATEPPPQQAPAVHELLEPRAFGPPAPDGTIVQPSPFADVVIEEPGPRGADALELQFDAHTPPTPSGVAIGGVRPGARGTFGETPLLHVLAHVLDEGMTGSLVVEDPGRASHALSVEAGAPTKARTAHPIAPLGEELIARGLLTPVLLETALAEARRERILLGEYLVREGLASRAEIDLALRAQLEHRLQWLGKLPPETAYRLHRDHDLLESWGAPHGVRMSPLQAILVVARVWRDRGQVKASLARLGQQRLALRTEADLAALELTPVESKVLQAVASGPCSLLDLHALFARDRSAMSAFVYALLLTRRMGSTEVNGLAMGARGAVAPEPDEAREDVSRPSFPSVGTSPSAVADAVGGPGSPAGGGSRPEDAVRAPGEQSPSAKGNLGATPLVHVLVYMFDKGETGTLVVQEPDGVEHVAYFWRGAPAKVKTGRALALLGEQLVSAGMVDARAIADAVTEARELQALLGEYLVIFDLVEREKLQEALGAQVVAKLASLVNLPPASTYAFYRDTNLLDGWAGTELFPRDPLAAVVSCTRAWADRERVRGTLGRIGKRTLRLHSEAALAGLREGGEVQSVVAALGASEVSLTSLLQSRVVPREVVESVVYALAVTRQFAFTSSRGKPMAPPTAEPEPPVAREPAPHRPEPSPSPPAPASSPGPSSAGPVSSRPSRAPGLIPWITFPPPSSRDGQPSRRPPGIAAPPAVSEPPVVEPGGSSGLELDLPPSSPAGGAVRPGQALLAALEAGGGSGEKEPQGEPSEERSAEQAKPEPESSERALQAMSDFRKADAAMQRGDLEFAEHLVSRAMASDPAQPDYPALLAWIRSFAKRPTALADAVAALGHVLRLNPGCELALLYRGRLHARANRLGLALKDFEAVVAANPAHREAQSEARLIRARLKKK